MVTLHWFICWRLKLPQSVARQQYSTFYYIAGIIPRTPAPFKFLRVPLLLKRAPLATLKPFRKHGLVYRLRLVKMHTPRYASSMWKVGKLEPKTSNWFQKLPLKKNQSFIQIKVILFTTRSFSQLWLIHNLTYFNYVNKLFI